MLRKQAVGVGPNGPIDQLQCSFGGTRLVVGPEYLMESEERLFPESKHRSARIRKKLIKRYGGEFRRVPACYKCGNTLYMHPVKWEQLRSHLSESEHEVISGWLQTPRLW